MAIEKLTLDDALMIENVVNKINLIIEELEYLDKRIDRHWAYHRYSDKRVDVLEERAKTNKLKEL